jgi:hypothetical protein
MNLSNQIQLVSRIQVDLSKAAAHHHENFKPMAAIDCDKQAAELEDVLRTLRAVASIMVAFKMINATLETWETGVLTK